MEKDACDSYRTYLKVAFPWWQLLTCFEALKSPSAPISNNYKRLGSFVENTYAMETKVG